MAEVSEDELIVEGAIPPSDFHDDIERIVEVANWELELPSDLLGRLEESAKDLLVPNELLVEAAAALATGHLVLQGPPGTGKSSLARALCRAFHVETFPVTAHEDWSTFEVIGRQELKATPDGEEINPVNGFFTEAAIRCAGTVVRHFDDANEPQATWLLIDELNRAEPDRAFGELFTVLGTDDLVPVTLSHQADGNQTLTTPRRFRILATMNSVDRDFVNALSQGLRRRFTFLTVDVPTPRSEGEPWGSESDDASLASREYTAVLSAAVRRMLRRAGNDDDLDQMRSELVDLLEGQRPLIEALFEVAERVRYADESANNVPHVPVGTAPLIDAVELFLTRARLEADEFNARRAIDWAVAVKVVPLFEVGSVNRDSVRAFAEALPAPFDEQTRRALLQIAAEGMYFVG